MPPHPPTHLSGQWGGRHISLLFEGGVGTIEGPIVGAILFFVVQETLAQYGAWYLILLGVLVEPGQDR